MSSAIKSLGASRILFIDDNPAIHEVYAKILTATHSDKARDDFEKNDAFFYGEEKAVHEPIQRFTADSAYQGQEGVEFVERACVEGRPYSVALIDMRMPPGWDGVETAARIWQVDPNILVVFCTAYSDHSWGELTRALGRYDQFVILRKPFSNLELLQLVTALCQERW